MNVDLKIKELKAFLSDRMLGELPGILSHRVMMPQLDNIDYRSLFPEGQTQKASVLIALNENLDFPIILRPESETIHSNQLALPGGKSEGSETSLETALREAKEEINLTDIDYEYIGKLSDLFIQPSRFVVTPEVIFVKDYGNLYPDEVEVQKIIFTNIFDLTFKKEIVSFEKTIFGKNIVFPCWNIGERVPLWGATAMILSELSALLREFYK